MNTETTTTEHTEPPTSRSILRQQLARMRRQLNGLRAERQQLGVPAIKDRLNRRAELAAEMAEIERELTSLSDALPLVEAEERQARQEADRQERQQLTLELASVFGALTRERDDCVNALSERSVATVDDLRDLRERGRQCEDLRVVLSSATGDSQFAKAIDPVDQLERMYREQREQRERHFALLRMPGAPRPTLPKNDRLARLRALVAIHKGADR